MWFAVCILLCVVLLAQGQLFLHCQTCIRSNKAINGFGQLGEVLILWEPLLHFSLLFICKSFYCCNTSDSEQERTLQTKRWQSTFCLWNGDLAWSCSIASSFTNHKCPLGIAPSIALFSSDYHFNLLILICICFRHANVLFFFFFLVQLNWSPMKGTHTMMW